jgi:hypothetical protein
MTSAAEEPNRHDRVDVDVPPELEAAGSPAELAETVRQLLAHASLRDPAGPLTVRAHRSGHRIELWVDDSGPACQPETDGRLAPPAAGDTADSPLSPLSMWPPGWLEGRVRS